MVGKNSDSAHYPSDIGKPDFVIRNHRWLHNKHLVVALGEKKFQSQAAAFL